MDTGPHPRLSWGCEVTSTQAQHEPDVPALPIMTPEDAARITGPLLEACRAWISRYVVVSGEQADIMAAWVMHTYVFDAFEVTPYLFISSPEKGSGKSTLLRILKAVAYRGRSSSGMSGAALARVVEASRPTLYLDELDAQMKGNKETASALSRSDPPVFTRSDPPAW